MNLISNAAINTTWRDETACAPKAPAEACQERTTGWLAWPQTKALSDLQLLRETMNMSAERKATVAL